MDPTSVPYISSAPSGGGERTLDRFIPRAYADVFTGDGGVVFTLLRRHSGAQVEVVRDTVCPLLAKIVLSGGIRQIETAEWCITRICSQKKLGYPIIDAFPPGELRDYFNERVPQDQEVGQRGLRRGVEGSAYKYPGMDHDIKLPDYFKYPYGQNYVDGHYPQSFQPPPPPPPPPFDMLPPPPPPPPQTPHAHRPPEQPSSSIKNVQGHDEI